MTARCRRAPRAAVAAWVTTLGTASALMAGSPPADPLAAIIANSFANHTVAGIVGRSSRPVHGQPRPFLGRIGEPDRDRRDTGPRGAHYDELVDRYSAENRLDANLVRAVIQAESGGDPRAVSRKGARGLMQLMPATGKSLGAGDLFDPEHNIASGTRYLRSLLDRYRTVEVALWAYNAGPQAVEQGRMPLETREYVPRVMRLRRQLGQVEVR